MKNSILRYVGVLCVFCATSFLYANPISSTAAQKIVSSWTQTSYRRKPTFQSTSSASLVSTPLQHVYVYNLGENGGYVIVSGDDEARSLVLGYGDGHIVWEDLSEQMQWWLSQYDEQIATYQAEGVHRQRTEMQTYVTPVNPLVKSEWNQRFPYNNACPRVNDSICLTGCVATAWGMICKYYQCPTSVSFDYSYTWDKQKITRSGSVSSTYDYSKLRNKYSTSTTSANYGTAAERAEVAKLLSDIGNNVDMDYGPKASGANSLNALKKMVANYGYDCGARQIHRKFFDDASWEKMLRAEVAAGRVVEYNGTKPTGGAHAFLCDGYDEVGKLHFNFGWGGVDNGYFITSAITYSSSQYAMIGIQPAKPGSVIGTSMGAVSDFKVYTSGSTTQFMYDKNYYTSVHTACSVERTICAENVATGMKTYGTVKTSSYQNDGNYYPTSSSYLEHTVALTDGIYFFYPVYRTKGAAEWRKVDYAPGYQSYLKIQVKNGKRSLFVDEFKVKGINYKIIDTDKNYVSVIGSDRKDSLTLFSTVTYNSTTYTIRQIADSAFAGYTLLRYVYFGINNLEDLNPDNGIFLNAGVAVDSLNVLFPSSVTRVPAYLFCPNEGRNAPNVKKVTFNYASSKSLVSEIGAYAFYGLKGLSAISLPKALTYLGEGAFAGCTSLGVVVNYAYCPPATSAGAICMDNNPTGKFQCQDSYNAYQNNPFGVWNLFPKKSFLNTSCTESFSCAEPVTDLDDFHSSEISDKAEKLLINGQIVIRMGNSYYNMLGVQL